MALAARARRSFAVALLTPATLTGQETFEQVAGRLETHVTGLGWTWREADPTLRLLRLTRDGYVVAASIFTDDGYASITGGAGCIATLDDLPEEGP
ncbi:hypothetical protein [Litorihabitans aurantiacus]|uniref:Uncharacterized protein n=1 Tax=Litorihabitans aurantiacus TaxID=1930061 RepID=A0AA38CWL0_9MICO|nr:hypothetical protein [Litorihabitans aurantiacus]GMA33222.1 hypothetical protein GCM10025875_32140 [Litorihabitans aurantiacus]